MDLSASKPAASKPLIGLTSYRQQSQSGVWNTEAVFLPTVYVDGVTNAGGIAVVLPPQPLDSDAARAIVASLDGIVICGGRDVDPALYGQTPGEHTDAPDTLRDQLESQLFDAAIETDLPFLAICRGLQVLNVNRGGTLIQHLPDVVGSNKYQLGGGVFTQAEIKLEGASALRNALDSHDTVTGAVYHHQAIDQVGAGLRVTATTADGVIEAVELEGQSFGVAVQWHPEQTPEDARLFQALIAAAAKHRSNK